MQVRHNKVWLSPLSWLEQLTLRSSRPKALREAPEYMKIERAKKILTDNTKVLYGIFGIIEHSPFFPPYDFLNEFLKKGSDPCDQDSRMGHWEPFELNLQEYKVVAVWWLTNHSNKTIDALEVNNWDDWQLKIIESNY